MPRNSKINQFTEVELKNSVISKFNRKAGKDDRMIVDYNKGEVAIIKVSGRVVFDVRVDKKYKSSKPKVSIEVKDSTLNFFKGLEERITYGLENVSSMIKESDGYDSYISVTVNQSSPGNSNIPIWLLGEEEASFDLTELKKGTMVDIYLRPADYIWDFDNKKGFSVQAECIRVTGLEESQRPDYSEQCDF